MKSAMLNDTWIEDMEMGDTDDKEELIAEVINAPVSKALNISGSDFVSTMSDAAVEYFSTSAIYWATEGNFSFYNSAKWSYKKPESKPENAFKCAAQRGKCECAMGSTIYYGAKNDEDRLDETQAYFKGEADFSGSTNCKNSIFGDPIPGTSKYCFCDELANEIHPVAEFCAENGETCDCESGNNVAYGQKLDGDDNTTNIDLTYRHWEQAADASGSQACEASTFGASSGLENYACFCEGAPAYDNFCSNLDVEQYVGCFEDDEYDRDFEELLSSSIYKPQECLDLVWKAGYQYAGIQAGSQCWGSSRIVGKHGQKDDCTYKCSNGQECGGQYSNTVYKFAFTMDELCSGEKLLEMTRMVAYNTDIIPFAQASLANPSGDGVTFVMEDKAGTSWEMEAVRQSDGSIRGFKVGEECPYYESEGWTYANLIKNSYGEYAILESWESAVDDFTFVWEFAEFGSQAP
jgi:hypothetical protein